MIAPLLQVAIGGALGASARYLTNVSLTRALGPGFPWGTVVVNIIGSLVMGILVVALAKKGANAYAPLLLTGMMGGFTTFSAFSLDALALFERGHVATAMGYVAGTVTLSIAAFVVGGWATRAILS